jgi:hypothetical protein
MDNPEPVSRVTPPSTTIANTSPQQTRSHIATDRSRRVLSNISFIRLSPGTGVKERKLQAAGRLRQCATAEHPLAIGP